jgi:hypothetical protein
MRTDGQADMTKLTVAFRDFANACNYQQAPRCQTSDALIPSSMETARGVTGPLYNVLLRKQSSKKRAVRLRIDASRYLTAHKYLCVMRNENK